MPDIGGLMFCLVGKYAELNFEHEKQRGIGMIRLKAISEEFLIFGDYLFSSPIGSGHINDTFISTYNQAGHRLSYIFQRINTTVFKNPEELMNNISRVTKHLRKKYAKRKDSSRRTLTVVPTRDGKEYFKDVNGKYWRCYLYVERTLSYDILESADQAYKAARAFAEFQRLLCDLPGPKLHETITDFHNTPVRMQAFDRAVAENSENRLKDVADEIAFVNQFRPCVSRLVDLGREGKIPERIIHNDAKLNNVMLDDITNEGICVVDLDTVMPGFSLYDFGDLIRTSISPAAEDEADLSQVSIRMDVFEATVRGFIEGYQGKLNDTEIENLTFSGILITFENGLRFLTDYLSGDVYFKTRYPEHNLVRARNQFKLVREMLEHQEELQRIVMQIKEDCKL